MQRTFSSLLPEQLSADQSHLGSINKQDILNLHQAKTSEGQNFAASTAEIVNTLGGIDKVLTICLQSDDTVLQLENLQKLHQILSIPQNEVKPSLTYTFDPEQIWDFINPRFAQFVNHKCTVCIMILLALIGYGMHRLFRTLGYAVMGDVCDIAVNWCFAIPYLIAVVLSLNPDSFKLVFKSFDFKIKVMLSHNLMITSSYDMYRILSIYFLSLFTVFCKHSVCPNCHSYALLWSITFCVLEANHDVKQSDGENVISQIQNISVSILTILITVSIASLDAIPKITKVFKVGISIFFAMYFTWRATAYQFFQDTSDDYTIHIERTNTIISFHGLMASWTRVLAIFMWKQGINAYRKDGRCISITHIPYINWSHSDEKDGNKKDDMEMRLVSTKRDAIAEDEEIDDYESTPPSPRNHPAGDTDTKIMEDVNIMEELKKKTKQPAMSIQKAESNSTLIEKETQEM